MEPPANQDQRHGAGGGGMTSLPFEEYVGPAYAAVTMLKLAIVVIMFFIAFAHYHTLYM